MATPRSARVRAISSVALIVLACMLAFVSVIAVWTRALVLNTDAYVRAVGPLIEKPALRDELSLRIVDELYQHVDVPKLLREALPKRGDVLAPTLAQGIRDTSVKLASTALGTAAVRRVWENANRVAHDQVVHVLEGKGDILTTDKGEVAVELRPLAEKVREALDANGVHLFDNVPASTLDRRFVLFRSADLARAQRATRLLDALGTWLPLVTVLVFAGAVAASEQRRRAIGRCALALAATMVVLTVGVAVGRSFYLDHAGGQISRAAAAVPFDGLVRSLRRWVRLLFAAAIVVWFVTWIAGSREMLAREREVRDAIGGVVRAHGRVLAGAGVIVAALLLVGWDRPSPRTIVAVIALLVLWEIGLRVFARVPPSDRVDPVT
ncbi:MAG TPA: hypothetical protein VL769_10205 [Acidimicrobiia bacterium]|nr:hypothetical protein [Acidimicrobiia bacterium]